MRFRLTVPDRKLTRANDSFLVIAVHALFRPGHRIGLGTGKFRIFFGPSAREKAETQVRFVRLAGEPTGSRIVPKIRPPFLEKNGGTQWV
jgi:hypothetical protein